MTTCRCGSPVRTVEIIVRQRCERGHFVTSEVAPAILKDGVPQKATAGQIRAFHAKCTTVDKLRNEQVGSCKKRLLAERGMESASEFTMDACTKALDDLEFQIETLAAA